MAIKSRNKINAQFSTASMSDLVFLLLIFFMLTSTLVSPNAIKLLLPSSSSKTMARQSLTVYIDATNSYFVEETPVNPEFLVETIGNKLQGQQDASVVLRADQQVPVQYVVTLIDAVNQVNELTNTRHKVILATKPAK
ncbi:MULTISPECIES: biopolymer transporter ExbD [Lentimicrobium]|jgi:biopolymer transport protein ExbD|uniref:Biopolymer transport protein ExbD n=1 Tax=Lentimicrobium saccharophilum TaxID=1678841 RepID=A0A0S7C7J1_9BACT|nr:MULTISPECIES: biopolymer transporter ExbD [Lentimicrobium]MCO5255912.1 biopolymer transporter ExbD [Lentimicrobium sp.]GAP45023.1 biopolymer transport protein ExbD [Lentimicrobium saccharophilum]HOP12489.1 biopolymer transporter ExbD [Lentimicrobium sp.]HPF63690.1 biopolymer transporter ExbD [Lentimicrobium sp.]HPJ61287.1 biopolymer transporter ExbD [Lentimicrobium sp.]